MLLLDGKNRGMFVEMVIMFYGIFLKNSTCESSAGIRGSRTARNVLFVSTKRPDETFTFPSEAVYRRDSEPKLCFNVTGDAACCNNEDFDCNFVPSENCSLFLDKGILSKQDIVLMAVPDDDFSCMPSMIYSKKSGFLLNILKCLNKGTKNIRCSQNCLYGQCSPIGLDETTPGHISITLPPPDSNSLNDAVNTMNNLSSVLEKMGSAATANIIEGDIKGVIVKISQMKPTNIFVGITASGDLSILENWTGMSRDSPQFVRIPKEASEMALKRNGSFAGVVLFPGIHPTKNDRGCAFLNNEIVGIEMGAEIFNLSETIDIHYKNVSKNGSIASCRSWDGKGKEATWITDGCQTNQAADGITCRCSHLTFFAILLSPPPQNMSSSDFTALTYITSIGCGLSVSFLAAGLFMHCLIRKGKASQATKILMNLFVAMLTLNLSFLVNESIANLGNFVACVAIAACTHYTMLATCTWFFMEALQLYFNLSQIPTDIKHYMLKICIPGWATPAVVVICLIALGEYGHLVISRDDGNSATMCWISDALVHQMVNIGYYGIVFIFTFSTFVITVRRIVTLKPAAGMGQTIKAKSFSILSLYLLLGITWAFAFFSYGPLLTASCYIFTILNSFQGFFLFIYYYHSRKCGDRDVTGSSNSTVTSNTVATSKGSSVHACCETSLTQEGSISFHTVVK